MIFTFLGTGTSQGIPVIACDCKVCNSADPRDKRMRCSAWIHDEDLSIVIDIGPDFRQQALINGISNIDAILLTHEHADHTAGLDDIRPINFNQGSIPFFGEQRVLDDLKIRFHYSFQKDRYPGLPEAELVPIKDGQSFLVKNSLVQSLRIWHGKLGILAFKFGSLVYITDASEISPEVLGEIQSIDVLIINALRQRSHHSHLQLSEALDYARIIGARRTYLTHLSHQLGLHGEVQSQLPDSVLLAEDGLSFSFNYE